MARRVKKLNPSPPREIGCPTVERIMKSRGDYDVGDDQQGARVYTFRDSPLDRLRASGTLSEDQYQSLMWFRRNWYVAGMAGHVSSIDPNRVSAPETAGYALMPRGEAAAAARGLYRQSVQAMGLEKSAIVEAVVCHERPLYMAGARAGVSDRTASQDARIVLRDSSDILARLYGLASRRCG